MSYTNELLDKFKTKNHLASDYAAAKALGIAQQSLTNYRSGVSHADDRVAVLLADALGLDRFRTIARIQSERAKKAEERAFWKRLSTAAAILLAVYTSMMPAPGNAASASVHILQNADVLDIADVSG